MREAGVADFPAPEVDRREVARYALCPDEGRIPLLDEVIAEIHRSDEEDHSVRLPAAERRRMARREPSQARNDATRGCVAMEE